MSDLISRQDALDALEWKWAGKAAFDAIKNLPSAQQWIPVREQLPPLWDEKYLVSLAWGGVGVMEYKDTGFHNYGSFSPVPLDAVLAWMPLPKPWKGEEDE